MRQQDVIIKQLAQKIVDFIEPVIPYLVIGSKKAAEEACKKVGSGVWETKRKLWEKLCSTECIELKEAAGDMIVAPSDTDVRQVFIQEIFKLLEKNPDLVKEVSSFMDYKTVQKLMTEGSSAMIIKQISKQGSKQTLSDRIRVLDEFNRLLEAFVTRKGISQGPERYGMQNTEKPVTGLKVVGEKSPSDLRIEQIAEIRHITKTSSAKAGAEKTDNEIQDKVQKAKALLMLISRLEKSEKRDIMGEALDFASQIQYGDLRSQALSLSVLYMDEPKKAESIEKALESASHIQDENERALVLSSLLPHLRGSGKEELIENIFCFSHHLQYGDTKFQILSSLVPHLYGLKNEAIIERALELIEVIFSDYQKVQALSSLIPYLNEQKKEEVLEQVLQLAFGLKDKDMRPEALSYVLPHLDEPRKEEILKKALNLASGIKSESQKSEALSSLSPYLDETENE
ncbi:hypothetical protein MSBRW_1779 [Methanosarcina barkeri str. Wiesmoor]|uniref:Uncharacterized protein n=2 Tax=Methanosarcina barkeri TaxID=2208 RepID=A0A0E3QLD5_METBA|nr:hypothetical protein [Methanosarcina barkeri]AKB51032.1 hypothetical protein MSBRW_1779 [Methanosarcina barkeri str. Wiesmoor]